MYIYSSESPIFDPREKEIGISVLTRRVCLFASMFTINISHLTVLKSKVII